MSRANRGPLIAQYDANGNPLSPLTIVQARRLVLDGDAVPTNGSCSGELPGWHGRAWRDWPAIRLTHTRETRHSSPSLTMGDMLSCVEESRTARLTDEARREREARGLPPEDRAERAQNKLQAWPGVHDTRAVCISAGRVCQSEVRA
jgi:hypothetical protein